MTDNPREPTSAEAAAPSSAQPTDVPPHRPGDKVRIKVGEQRGARGLVERVGGDVLTVALATGLPVEVPPEAVTNYSLAARRAWATMPKRAGRPKADGAGKRMVSLRLDIAVWEGLADMARRGMIASREQAVNEWLREKLKMLSAAGARSRQSERAVRALRPTVSNRRREHAQSRRRVRGR